LALVWQSVHGYVGPIVADLLSGGLVVFWA